MADLYSPKKTETVVTSAPTAFWPVLLVGLSVCAILVWQLRVANQVKEHGLQMRDQQVKMVDQSKKVQVGLQKFARDLIEVAKTDDEAKAIVTKYRHQRNQSGPRSRSRRDSVAPQTSDISSQPEGTSRKARPLLHPRDRSRPPSSVSAC